MATDRSVVMVWFQANVKKTIHSVTLLVKLHVELGRAPTRKQLCGPVLL